MKVYKHNEWITDAVKASLKSRYDEKACGRSIFYRAAEASASLLHWVSSFDGSKVVISCSPKTQLIKLVKNALCFADLVIVVPAPLWISCDYLTLSPYSEFNQDGLDDLNHGIPVCSGFNTLNQIGHLFSVSPSAAELGAVTFLPIMGMSAHRWQHPFLDLPDLPRPYSSHVGPYDMFDIHSEAMYNLCIERLVAEKLGAAHLNGSSFSQAAINDLHIGKDLVDNTWSHAILEVTLPALDKLPLDEVIALRRELPDAMTSFSNAVLAESKSMQAQGLTFDDNIRRLNEHINAASNSLITQMRELSQKSVALTGKTILKTTAFALGVSGLLGSMSSSIGFLLGGGMIWDLKDMISMYRSTKMKIRNE